MLYPLHFELIEEHAKNSYDATYAAIVNIKQQYPSTTPFKVYPYIELSNYKQQFTEDQLIAYINGQIAAVEDAKADGWYAWSAGNKYDRLFNILTRTT